jgi:hypothetical protein
MTDLNNLECIAVYNRKNRVLLYHEWTLTLTPEVIEDFTNELFPFIEIELLKGTKRSEIDGRTRYQFCLDNKKSRLLKQILLEPSFCLSDN